MTHRGSDPERSAIIEHDGGLSRLEADAMAIVEPEPPVNMLPAALAYASRGWRVLPAEPGGKRPLIRRWPERATTDAEQIRQWWRRWPNANIGITTGRESGIYVLDVDVHPERRGDLSLLALVDRIGPIEHIAHALTGSGGDHYYRRYPDGADVPNAVDALGPGLDVRGNGGYVIAPPSMHASGERYRWAVAP